MEGVSCLKQLGVEYEFGCGFLVFGSFQGISEFLGMLLLFGFGLKILCCDWFSLIRCVCDLIGKLKARVCSESGVDAGDDCFIHEMEEWKENSNSYIDSDEIVMNSDTAEEYDSDNNVYLPEKSNAHSDFDDNENVVKEPHTQEVPMSVFDEEEFRCYNEATTDEDGESDDNLSSLRRQLKIERHRATAAQVELAKERAAAATAAEEAMAMILRLQHQKSAVEMELMQYRRVAEEKQVHDQEVIQSLQWLVWRHDCETSSLLEDQLKKLCKHDLDGFVEEGEGSFKGNLWDAFENVYYSSLDAGDDHDILKEFLYRY